MKIFSIIMAAAAIASSALADPQASAIAAHWEMVAVSSDHHSAASVALEGIDIRSGYTTAWIRRERWSATGEALKPSYDLMAFDCKERKLAFLRQGLSEEPTITGPTLSDLPFVPTFASPSPDSIDFKLVSVLCHRASA